MLTQGTILQNRYEIVAHLAQGGMGTIYEAIDNRFNNLRVALKQLRPDLSHEDRWRAAFNREANLLAQLKNPHLPHVKDFFSEPSGHFLVMEWVTGRNLEELKKRQGGIFPFATVRHWMDQLFPAVCYLHNQTPPIIHRDIKPPNVKINEDGTVFLIDFGIARELLDTNNTLVFPSSLSTPYTALELIEGGGVSDSIDVRCDVYSLGIMCYWLLTGVTPPKSLTRLKAAVRRKPDPVSPVAELNPEVPPNVSNLVAKMMAILPEDRCASVKESWTGWQETIGAADGNGGDQTHRN